MKKGVSNNIQNDLEENDYEAKRTFDRWAQTRSFEIEQ